MENRRGGAVRVTGKLFALAFMLVLLQLATSTRMAASPASCGAADSACHESCYLAYQECVADGADPGACMSGQQHCQAFCQAAYWDCLGGVNCVQDYYCWPTETTWKCYTITFCPV